LVAPGLWLVFSPVFPRGLFVLHQYKSLPF
jgi:hypothetical protein